MNAAQQVYNLYLCVGPAQAFPLGCLLLRNLLRDRPGRLLVIVPLLLLWVVVLRTVLLLLLLLLWVLLAWPLWPLSMLGCLLLGQPLRLLLLVLLLY
jgi:hypothetical protein